MRKNKLYKKIACGFLTASLTAAVLAGCSSNNGKTETPAPAETGKETAAGAEAKPADPDHPFYVTDEPKELTIHMHYWDYMAFDDNWKVFTTAADMTNVKLKGTTPAGASNSKEIFNMMMTSGDIPDIVNAQVSEIKKYGAEGAFYPLNEIMEECAPDFVKFLDENPDIKKGITNPDGNIYVIPYVTSDPIGKVWFIRQDWLDKFNLEAPTTPDEVYTVLKTFVDGDANGNGIKDETGYFGKASMEAIPDLLGLFGVPAGFYVQNGKIVSSMYMPEIKEGIKEITKWYQEGLIDKEIFTRGGKAREVMFGQDIGAMTHDWFPSTSNFNDIVSEEVDGFHLVAIAPPNAQLGTPIEYSNPGRAKLEQQGIAISASTADPKLVLRYLNFFWTEEGRRLANFGVEGEEYTMVDGKPKYTEEFLASSDKSVKEKLEAIGAQSAFGYEMDYDYTLPTLHEEAIKAMDLYSKGNYMADAFPMLAFTDEEQAIYDKNCQSLETYYFETLQKWILGAADIDATFDEYMNRMKELGMEDILSAYQAAYDRFQNN